MGEVIRKSADAEDIYKDLDKTIENAKVRGGHWESRSAENLVPVQTIRLKIKQDIDGIRPAADQARAKVDYANDKADDVILTVQDDMFNATGRVLNDPYATVIFPGGAEWYVEGETASQPYRMGILVELFNANIHPRLSAEKAQEFANRITVAKDELAAAIANATPLLAKVDGLERTYVKIARVAQMALASSKRFWKSAGESETAIHEVIPDRPVS